MKRIILPDSFCVGRRYVIVFNWPDLTVIWVKLCSCGVIRRLREFCSAGLAGLDFLPDWGRIVGVLLYTFGRIGVG